MIGFFRILKKILGLAIMPMAILPVSGCDSEPKMSYNNCQLHTISIDSENGIVCYTNDKIGNKFFETTPDGLLQYNGEGIYSVKGQWRTLKVMFHNNEYPKSLDNLFVIENITDKKQRCFAYMEGHGNSYKDSIFDLNIEIKDINTNKDYFKNKILNLIHMTKDGRPGLDVYWDEVHAVNPSVAIELQPKEKIYMKWE